MEDKNNASMEQDVEKMERNVPFDNWYDDDDEYDDDNEYYD